MPASASIVCITEGIPVNDMVRVKAALAGGRSRLVGPNCPGVITPGECKVGIMPGFIHKPGRVGIISRSGTLTYEAVFQTTNARPRAVDLRRHRRRPGARPEFHRRARALREGRGDGRHHHGRRDRRQRRGSMPRSTSAAHVTKPVVAYIAGVTAPAGKRMGHAGAVIAGGKGTAADKYAALEEAGVAHRALAAELGSAMKKALAAAAAASAGAEPACASRSHRSTRPSATCRATPRRIAARLEEARRAGAAAGRRRPELALSRLSARGPAVPPRIPPPHRGVARAARGRGARHRPAGRLSGVLGRRAVQCRGLAPRRAADRELPQAAPAELPGLRREALLHAGRRRSSRSNSAASGSRPSSARTSGTPTSPPARARAGADLVLALNASPYQQGKQAGARGEPRARARGRPACRSRT